MTTHFIELETITNQELQAAAGGIRLGRIKPSRPKPRKPTQKSSIASQVGTAVVEGGAFAAGEIAIQSIADALIPDSEDLD